MSLQAYVDESKVGGLTFVVAVVPAQDVTRTRQQMKSLKPPGAARLHFSNDSPAVRTRALAVIRTLPVSFRVFDVREFGEGAAARQEGIRQMVPELSSMGVTRLVLEDDHTMRRGDRQTLYNSCRSLNGFTYDHCTATEDALLWIPDALAWCLRNRDRQWRAQALGLINQRQNGAQSA